MSTLPLFPSPQDLGDANKWDGTKANAMTNAIKYGFYPHAVINKIGSTYYAQYSTGTGTSGTNAYTVVNTAINDIYTANSMAVILLGPHTFDFANNSLNLLAKSNIIIMGAGMDATTILNGAITNTGSVTTSNLHFADLTINANSNRASCMNLQKVAQWGLERVKLANSSSSFLLNWSGSDHFVADNCIFSDGGLTLAADNVAGGQVLTNENESVFRHCKWLKANSLGGGQLTTGSTGNLLVDGCQFVDTSGNSYAAVSVENDFGVCKEVRIVNSRAYGATQGFAIGNTLVNQIERAIISGCISTGPQSIYKAREAMITDGISYNSRGAGFALLNNTVAKLSDSIAKNTNALDSGTDFDKGGMYAKDNTRLEIDGLDVYDTTGFTPHGIRASSTALDTKEIYINNCNLVGPFSGVPLQLTNFLYVQWRGGSVVGTSTFTTNTTLKINNVNGYVTEAQGTGTITSAATSASVTHGLSYTPTASEISITFTENPTNTPRFCYITGITSTVFVVNVDSTPGASNLDFSWAVRRI